MSSVIEGTWKLQSFEVQKSNGTVDYPFGQNAIGYINYTASGHFSVQFMPKEQTRESLKGVSYFGRYDYNREKDYIVHHVEGSLFHSKEGLDKIRHARLRGKSLTLTCPPLDWENDQEAIATIKFEKQEEIPEVTVF